MLNGLVQMHDITQAQADTMQFPKMLTDTQASTAKEAAGTTSTSDPWAPYLMNVVYNELTAPVSDGGDGVPVATLETGGLKIITTISRPMEVEMYHAVNENIAAIKASGYTLPSYALIGAVLQNPNTGAIAAMYPGRGQNMSASQCKIYDCDLNTAVYSREQVGSSFKPYVLATAVSQGMNVQTSILNASPTLYVPPETDPLVLSTTDPAKAMPESFEVSNDGGEVISNKPGGAISVQNALALSSNTAYTDLAHRVGTGHIIQMAANMGVNIAKYPRRVQPEPARGPGRHGARYRLADRQRAGDHAVHYRQRRHLPPVARHPVVAGAGRRGAASPRGDAPGALRRPSTRRSSTRWR